MTEKPNTFEQFEKDAAPNKPVSNQNEVKMADLSDTPVGDVKKYNRQNLDGQTVTIDSFEIQAVNINEPTQKLQNGTTEYWKNSIKIVYDTENEDGMQDREYISGARQFKQTDGTASPISFWYPDAMKQTQVAELWEKVASFLGKEPDRLSPREFNAFLNSKPKAVIESVAYDNFGAKPGEPKKVYKNMVKEFVKA